MSNILKNSHGIRFVQKYTVVLKLHSWLLRSSNDATKCKLCDSHHNTLVNPDIYDIHINQIWTNSQTTETDIFHLNHILPVFNGQRVLMFCTCLRGKPRDQRWFRVTDMNIWTTCNCTAELMSLRVKHCSGLAKENKRWRQLTTAFSKLYRRFFL